MSSQSLDILERAESEIINLSTDSRKTKELLKVVEQTRSAEYEKSVEQLKKKVEDYETPPLRHGILIGPSPDHSSNYIVGNQGSRIEVKLSEDAGLGPQDLFEGQEVLLNENGNIVKVRTFAYSRGESAEILDIVNNGKNLHIKSGESGYIVETTSTLCNEIQANEVAVGDHVRLEPRLGIAFEKVAVAEARELELEEQPTETFEMIGGLENEIEVIRDSIERPYLYHKLFEKFHLTRPKGILLYGPPGCGKTMIAKAVANSLSTGINRHLQAVRAGIDLILELDPEDLENKSIYQEKYLKVWQHIPQQVSGYSVDETKANISLTEMLNNLQQFLEQNSIDLSNLQVESKRLNELIENGAKSFFMNIKGPELLNKYVGETESSIRKAFAAARKKASYNTPVVLFFDEMESMFRTRGSGISSDMESTIVPQLLAELDGVEKLENIIVIGASNRYELIDPAILRPGRLDIKIKVDRPNRDSAIKILAKYLTANIPFDEDELKLFENNRAETVDHLIQKMVNVLYDEMSYFQVVMKSAKQKNKYEKQQFRFSEFISGALIESIISRAKKSAVKRQILLSESGSTNQAAGLKWKDDLLPAIIEEYEENKMQFVAQKTSDLHANLSPLSASEIETIISEDELTFTTVKVHPYLN